VGLELTSGLSPPPVFNRRLLIRPDGFRRSSCGGWNRTNMKTFRTSRPTVRRPRIALFIETLSRRKFGEKGSKPSPQNNLISAWNSRP
jgi:hypothetical protein